MFTATIVSGFWDVPNKYRGSAPYEKWFRNTLAINCPYVFFGDKRTIALAERYRHSRPTEFIYCGIDDFYTWRYKDKITTHPLHVPSRELSMIWNEKVFLVQRAAEINPFGTDWFAWVDAGICFYRELSPPKRPWPDVKKVRQLPKDKMVFTSSDLPEFEPHRVNDYYHFVSATAFLLHRQFVPKFAESYRMYVDTLLSKEGEWKYTEQVILTQLYRDKEDVFYRLGHGHGFLLPLLYSRGASQIYYSNIRTRLRVRTRLRAIGKKIKAKLPFSRV